MGFQDRGYYGDRRSTFASEWTALLLARVEAQQPGKAGTIPCCKTALDVATNDEVKAALRQHGARHSLFYAVEQGMLELVADLIKEGADMNERDEVSLYRVLSVAFSV